MFMRPARRAKESSPVRQHWEKDDPASAPERGGRTDEADPLFRPVPGLTTRPPATHGGAPWATIYRPSGSRSLSGLPHMKKQLYPICAKAFSIAALVAASASAGGILRTASLKGSARTGP